MDTDERGQTLREDAGFCGRRASAMREPFIPEPGVKRAGWLGNASNFWCAEARLTPGSGMNGAETGVFPGRLHTDFLSYCRRPSVFIRVQKIRYRIYEIAY